VSTKYQIIIIGAKSPLIKDIVNILYHHIKELGLTKKLIFVIKESNFYKDYKNNAPAYCLYFGDNSGDFKNLDILITLINDATLILPIVDDLSKFNKLIPKELENINGF
jgi:hypothetical protein